MLYILATCFRAVGLRIRAPAWRMKGGSAACGAGCMPTLMGHLHAAKP